jgi:hypothetical protein
MTAVPDEIHAPDWQSIAKGLYDAIGLIENVCPGGLPYVLVESNMRKTQAAIDAYEYAEQPCTNGGES